MGKYNVEHTKTLNTSLGMIQYSIYTFIKVIRENVNLWDRKHEDFHNREQRERTWQSVTRELCSNYNLLKEDEQQELAKILLKRWKNTRDCFLRAYRLQQMGDTRACSYIYEEELMFLLKDRNPNAEKTITNDNGDGTLNNNNVKKQNRKTSLKSTLKSNEKQNAKKSRIEIKIGKLKSPLRTLVKRRQSPRNISLNKTSPALQPAQNRDEININDNLNTTICTIIKSENNTQAVEEVTPQINSIVELNDDNKVSIINDDDIIETINLNQNNSKSNDVRHQNINLDNGKEKVVHVNETICNDPDQGFFDSIKPHLQNMNDEQKLDFKIEVLKILRNFNK